ncbi:autotransporter outer membrane beta-barrel domain-containing protein [Buttiauxella agrestis]|nr:autotransporter outer membrane beta-barrel domain-containing protein [Buttiauxella agrestis]
MSAANTSGIKIEDSGTVTLTRGVIKNNATAAAGAKGQTGVFILGDSRVDLVDSIITLEPLTAASAIVTASDMTGVLVENGKLSLENSSVTMGGGTKGINNRGIVATGNSSLAALNRSSVKTYSSSSVGITAKQGGSVDLKETSVETSGNYSHVLLASDDNSSIHGEGLQLTTSAVSASAARAENKGEISLKNSQITSSGAATSSTTTAALHALSGASITGTGLTMSVTGTNQGGSRAEGNNSAISLANSTVFVSGAGNAVHSSSAARAISGASVSVTNSSMTTTGSQSHGVSVEGAGSHAQIGNTTIETRGARSSSVNINDGASAEIISSKMTTTAAPGISGPWSPGILLQGAGSALILKDSEIITTENPASGISAINNSQLEVNTSRITTSGNYGTGIGVANSTAVITNSHINTSGNDNAMGIVANIGATVSVTGGSVTTTGNGSPVASNLTFPHAVASRSAGAMLTVDGTTLVTKGSQAYGATADDGGSLILKNLSVKTLGENSVGLYAGIGAAKPGDVNLSATNVSVETLGDNATGAFVGRKYKSETAQMALNNVALATHGDNSRGLWAEAGAGLTAKNTVVSTDGELSHGILASNGGQVLADNVVATTRGDSAAALAVQGSQAWTGQANLTNATLTSEHGHGIQTTGYAGIKMQNSRVTGESQWLQANNGVGNLPGNAHINLSGSIATGAALTASNAYSEVALNNTSLWFLTGNSVLSTLNNNQSLINFSSPENHQYKTLTVNNYHGDNGTIALNTHLHDDNSPSDQLVINGGHADGATNLKITNTDGSGALTRGNGIKVVDAISGATTDPQAFSLLNKVKAGPYEYSLYRSSVDDSNEEAWYLRSNKEPQRVVEEVDPPAPPPADPDPDLTPDEKPAVDDVKPSAPAEPPAAIPNYRAETSLYQDIPQLALLYSRMLVDSLHERTGEQFASPQKITQATESPHMSWGRFIYKQGKSDFDGPQSRFSLNAIQLGIDLYRESKDDSSSNFAGVLGNIGKINSKVTHTDGGNAGRNTLKSWGVGGYWTHFTPAGSYLDVVAQYNRLYMESSPTDLSPMKTKGYGLSASAETGYPWQPDEDVQRFIEPQAQLIYSTVKLDNTRDRASGVKFDRADSLTGRVSVRVHQTWNHEDSQDNKADKTRTTAWIRPGILHEFKGESKTEFSSQDGYIPFTTNSGGTWGQLNAGVDHQLNQSVSLTGSLSVEKSFEGSSVNYGGIAGIKIKF